MYSETIEGFTKLAERKITALRASPGGFFVASMLAGAYVGIGIIAAAATYFIGRLLGVSVGS